jgi:hypothetical protein
MHKVIYADKSFFIHIIKKTNKRNDRMFLLIIISSIINKIIVLINILLGRNGLYKGS